MKPIFRTYDHTDYETVCDFLIELSQEDSKHINWNWARWEWMMYHPDFQHDLIDRIGLWFCNEKLVGMATYDHYLGEAFYAVKKDYKELENDVLQYALSAFSDEHGLGIAVNNADANSIDLLCSHGFVEKKDYTENVLEVHLESVNFDCTLPNGIRINSL
jgi:hypothetical protein